MAISIEEADQIIKELAREYDLQDESDEARAAEERTERINIEFPTNHGSCWNNLVNFFCGPTSAKTPEDVYQNSFRILHR